MKGGLKSAAFARGVGYCLPAVADLALIAASSRSCYEFRNGLQSTSLLRSVVSMCEPPSTVSNLSAEPVAQFS